MQSSNIISPKPIGILPIRNILNRIMSQSIIKEKTTKSILVPIFEEKVLLPPVPIFPKDEIMSPNNNKRKLEELNNDFNQFNISKKSK